jgi:hypothetical protein
MADSISSTTGINALRQSLATKPVAQRTQQPNSANSVIPLPKAGRLLSSSGVALTPKSALKESYVPRGSLVDEVV